MRTLIAALTLGSACFFPLSPASAATCEELKLADENLVKTVAAIDAKKVDPLAALKLSAAQLNAITDIDPAKRKEINDTVAALLATNAGPDPVKKAFDKARVEVAEARVKKKC
ncbi:MAG: hypothetical protein KBE09_05630 [Candidatus Pacebacteria bacterium]|nr:hypothetical protein [Candidatus Paceibacterota bacterium]